MKNKWIRFGIIGIGILSIVVAGAAIYLNWLMKQPLYHLGNVASETNLRGSLDPPKQTDPQIWSVEPDIDLHFEAVGEGEPVLVVHGGPGIPYVNEWKGLKQLTKKNRFFYYHQRGCGKSTHPFDRFEGSFYENMTELERTLGLGSQIADIERIRKILDQEKITLIGHSYGGFIATLYAAEFPQHVNRLILIAPAGVLTHPDSDRNLFDRAREKLSLKERQVYDKLIDEYFDFGNIFSKSDSELSKLHLKVGGFLLQAMQHNSADLTGHSCGGWAVFAMYFSCGKAQDYRPALTRITAPTLILVGKDDELAIPGSKTYQAIPNSKFAFLKGSDNQQSAGHFLYDDESGEFGNIIEAFLHQELER